MKKTIIAVSILIILLMSITAITLTQKTPEKSVPNEYSYTTAICDETNFCQDHIVICEGKNIIAKIPITGAFIQFSKSWKDPRPQETIKEFCE